MTRYSRKRSAFTLVELLVSIAILSILSAMLMVAVTSFRKSARVRKSDDILFKIQKGIDIQIDRLSDQARDDRAKNTPEFQNLLRYCDNDADRAENLLGHLKVRHAFPMTYAEAQANIRIPAAAPYVINWPPHRAYASFASASPGTASPELQSAVLIHVALTKLATGGNTVEVDDIGAGAQIETQLGTAFQDGWGSPVGFKRFHEEAKLNNAPFSNIRDACKNPFDPLGKLNLWTNTASKNAAQNSVGTIFNINNKVVTPVSPGEDETFGTSDDLYGYRLRELGGKNK